MAKNFTIEEAERLLPALEQLLREAIAMKSLYDEAEADVNAITGRVAMLGGVLLDQKKLLAQRDRRDALAARLQETISAIEESGCVVKDLDIGLIDFPSVYRAEQVYLCWKAGEDGIHFWHGVDEGFDGRKPVDEHFRRNHGGTEP